MPSQRGKGGTSKHTGASRDHELDENPAGYHRMLLDAVVVGRIISREGSKAAEE